MTSFLTTETVRQQLLELGYSDVPPDLLDEFVQELNETMDRSASISRSFRAEQTMDESTGPHSTINSTRIDKGSPSTSVITASSPSRAVRQTPPTPVNRHDILRHLAALGYEPHSIPDDIVDELAQELNSSLMLDASLLQVILVEPGCSNGSFVHRSQKQPCRK
jgi:hypothetical protein